MHTHTFEHRIAFTPARPSGMPIGYRAWLAIAVVAAAATFATFRTSLTSAPVESAPSSAPTTVAPGLITSFGARHSHNGRYSAEVVDASPVAIGVAQSWTVHLTRRAERLQHASVTARAWMPEATEEASASGRVQYIGHGNYQVDGLNFSRSGWWNVALVIDAASGTDSVAFNVVIPPDATSGRPKAR